jgi:hypothetical protein
VLPVIGKDGSAVSDAATLAGYVGKLEHAFYDLAQNYYHQVIPSTVGTDVMMLSFFLPKKWRNCGDFD